MQDFTASRQPDTPDEIWLLEHDPVYTLGLAGKYEHLLDAGDFPVLQSDRGGQITWHGPGQLMIYTLLDTRRLGLGVRALVTVLEQVVVELLGEFAITAHLRSDAPGVYVRLANQQEAKIAALGLRLRRQGSYHGVALNISCDLSPFAGINPCGYAGMPVTRLVDLFPDTVDRTDIEPRVICRFAKALHYSSVQRSTIQGMLHHD
jgi:lipoyl(octanoyl) transferase